MLYVTTRNELDSFTVRQVLESDRGPEGGAFVPIHSPCFEPEEVEGLLALSFAGTVAGVLNRLLGLRVSDWDVSFCAGRFPVGVARLGSRLYIAEAWRNPKWKFDQTVKNLLPLLGGNNPSAAGEWGELAVRIALLAGICGQVRRVSGNGCMDLAVVSGDFGTPISAWYLRQWGFPIGNIICCCNENGSLWDLFANGQMRTDGVSVSTSLPEADVVVPKHFERLVYGWGGAEAAREYAQAVRQGSTYVPSQELLAKMGEGLFVSVVSSRRVLETLGRVSASRRYLLSPYDALCYCGVSDFWSRYAQINPVMILSERSPRVDMEVLSAAMGLPPEELKERL